MSGRSVLASRVLLCPIDPARFHVKLRSLRRMDLADAASELTADAQSMSRRMPSRAVILIANGAAMSRRAPKAES